MTDNKAAVVAAQADLTAATALTAKETACKATVAFFVNLDTLDWPRSQPPMLDYRRQASYEQAKAKCDSAKSTLTAANQAVATAETKAIGATA